MNELMIIKLGGAAITDKNQPYTAKQGTITSVIKELATIDQPLILIHGAGSFAHNLARDYQLATGLESSIEHAEQYRGVTKVRNSMQRLHQKILDEAELNNMNTFSLPISSTLITSGQNDEERIFFEPFKHALNHGFIPISYGDICFDATEAGFLVVSGDRIIHLLSKYFTDYTIRVIFGSDVDGFYDRHPNKEGAKLVPEIRFDQIDSWIEQAGDSTGIDVTGGMKGKLNQINQLSKFATRIDLVNITISGRLTQLLEGNNIPKTTFYSS